MYVFYKIEIIENARLQIIYEMTFFYTENAKKVKQIHIIIMNKYLQKKSKKVSVKI